VQYNQNHNMAPKKRKRKGKTKTKSMSSSVTSPVTSHGQTSIREMSVVDTMPINNTNIVVLAIKKIICLDDPKQAKHITIDETHLPALKRMII
jgi:hypothetical protein